jgi:hypothetical protein
VTIPPADGLDPLGLPYEQPGRGLDTIGWFIATLHGQLGHDKGAAVLGQPPGDRSQCVICAWERNPTPDRKQAVINAIGRPA